MILRVVLATESDEWFGSYLFQGDGFGPSERMRRAQRHAPRVGAQQSNSMPAVCSPVGSTMSASSRVASCSLAMSSSLERSCSEAFTRGTAF